MPALLALLPDPSGSGWGKVEWLVSCRALLRGGCPADYLAEGRIDEVLAVARIEDARSDQDW